MAPAFRAAAAYKAFLFPYTRVSGSTSCTAAVDVNYGTLWMHVHMFYFQLGWCSLAEIAA